MRGLLGFQGVSSIPEGNLEVEKGFQDKASPSASVKPKRSAFLSPYFMSNSMGLGSGFGVPKSGFRAQKSWGLGELETPRCQAAALGV